MVNLTVTCDKDVAHLEHSTGGLRVNGIRLAQNCTVLGQRSSSLCVSTVHTCTHALQCSSSTLYIHKLREFENNMHLINFNITNHGAMYYPLALPNCPQAGSFSANSFRRATLKKWEWAWGQGYNPYYHLAWYGPGLFVTIKF